MLMEQIQDRGRVSDDVRSGNFLASVSLDYFQSSGFLSTFLAFLCPKKVLKALLTKRFLILDFHQGNETTPSTPYTVGVQLKWVKT